jgi:hypothetical protein
MVQWTSSTGDSKAGLQILARTAVEKEQHMPTDKENFQFWFVDVLERLHNERSAGIASLMVTLPLLERYMRLKNGLGPNDPIKNGMGTLRTLFPVFTTDAHAYEFWTVYRHGFLHQATLSDVARNGSGLPKGWLSQDLGTPVEVATDGSFRLDPVSFSRRVIKTIEADFAIFVGAGTAAPALADAGPLVHSLGHTILGTGSR